MLAWALRCALLVVIGVVALHELDIDIELPRPKPPELATADRGARNRSSGGGAAYGSELMIPAAENGHFYVDAVVNGTPLPFMVDTGATFVVVSRETAADLGLRPANHEFTVRVQTANGIIRSAPVTLRQFQIGSLTIRDVEALVTDTPLGGSLLGLSFLGRLESYEVQRDRLVLRW